MADRNWTVLNCLAYMYNAFAVYTDADLDDAEKKEIFTCISEWAPESSRNDIMNTLETTLGWFIEDHKAERVVDEVVSTAVVLGQELPKETCQAIVKDLARIGRADGNYDEVEKKWAALIAEAMGVAAPA